MKPEYELIIKRLEELPKLISSQELKILEFKNKIIDTKYSMSKQERFMATEVFSAKTQEGKNKYTNAESRDRESQTRLYKSTDYMKNKATFQELNNARESSEIELRQLNNELSSLKYYIRVLQFARTEELEHIITDQEKVIENLKNTIRELKKI